MKYEDLKPGQVWEDSDGRRAFVTRGNNTIHNINFIFQHGGFLIFYKGGNNTLNEKRIEDFKLMLEAE